MFDPETRDAYAHDAVIAILPEETWQPITECEAFTAFAVTLAKAGSDDPATMGKILGDVAADLPEGRLEWVVANSDAPPAAYLNNRIRDYVAEHQAEQEITR